jgi:hypothetical protein
MKTLNNTKDLVSTLFRSGLTDNEQLQQLLWNLKEILELNNEDLGVNDNDDLRAFFVSYLTDLANLYRPTNSSKLPERILSIDNSLIDMTVGINEAFENLLKRMPSSPDEESNRRLTHECLNEIRVRCNQNVENVREITEKWLISIRY